MHLIISFSANTITSGHMVYSGPSLMLTSASKIMYFLQLLTLNAPMRDISLISLKKVCHIASADLLLPTWFRVLTKYDANAAEEALMAIVINHRQGLASTWQEVSLLSKVSVCRFMPYLQVVTDPKACKAHPKNVRPIYAKHFPQATKCCVE